MEAILPIALLVAAFYLLILRPMQTRSRRAAELKQHLQPGVEVITTAGIFGRVERVGTGEAADEVFLEIAPGVVVRMMSAAVGKILTPEEAAAAEAADTPAGEDPAPPKTL